jgi:hypothetical protein
VKDLPLHVGHDVPRVVFVPVPVQGLGHGAELDQKLAGQVSRLDLAALLLTEPEQGRLVLPHDNSGI